jgi:uncharacterized membrane protein
MLGAVWTSTGRAEARRRTTRAIAAVTGVTVADIVAAVGMSRHGGIAPVHAAARITVARPIADVYAAWRRLENLPLFMAHLQSVQDLGDGRTRWRAAGPGGVEVEWEAEIAGERVNEHISWQSVGKPDVRNSGRVDFSEAPGGRGTEVRVHLTYHPPAGKLGMAVAKLLGAAPDQQAREDLRRFKQVLEVGEVVRSEGSPHGADARAYRIQRPAQPVTT